MRTVKIEYALYNRAAFRGLTRFVALLLAFVAFAAGTASVGGQARNDAPAGFYTTTIAEVGTGWPSPTAAPTESVAGSPPSAAPVYVPPDVGAPVTRVAAGTRGPAGAKPTVFVLAPPQTGLTGRASPALFWYLSAPFSGPIEITLAAEGATEPLLEVRLDRGAEAGIHPLGLSEHRAELQLGVEYQWSVALVHDPQSRSADTYASGTIRRADRRDLPRDAVGLARAGYWYDALEAAGSAPAVRASFLEQVGLVDAAAWARAKR